MPSDNNARGARQSASRPDHNGARAYGMELDVLGSCWRGWHHFWGVDSIDRSIECIDAKLDARIAG